ncbi:MAG TPA: T9SS type A sorting domain-containing protein [Chitinophagaceae bacterium]|nr:T9SS type A sorting domain-containing protein [Chitinophagaceae bacterium]
MKLLHFFLLSFICATTTQAQIQLIATSHYNYDSTGYFKNDTSTIFYAAANTNPAKQNYADAYVTYQPDSIRFYFKNGASMDLQSRAIYSYGSNYDFPIKYQSHLYNNNVYFLYTNTDYYRTGNLLDSAISQSTTISTGNTNTDAKYTYHYNGLNLNDTTWNVYFSNGVYSMSQKNVTSYTASNNIAEIIYFESSDSINYTPDSKTNFFYSSAGVMDSSVFYTWYMNAWYKVGKNVFTNNSNQQPILKEYMYYDNTTMIYSTTTKEVYMRNNGIQRDSMFSMTWNQANMQFDTTVKYGYRYQSNLLTQSYGFTLNPTTLQWQPDPYSAINNYYYNEIPSSTNDIHSDKAFSLTVFPNPAETHITLKGDWQQKTYFIYTPQGQLVQTGTVSENQQVPVQLLSSGHYIIQVAGSRGMQKASFIKL